MKNEEEPAEVAAAAAWVELTSQVQALSDQQAIDQLAQHVSSHPEVCENLKPKSVPSNNMLFCIGRAIYTFGCCIAPDSI